MSKKERDNKMAKDKEKMYEFIDVSEGNKTDFNEETFIDKIFLCNKQYEIFFGETFIEEQYRPWKRGVIKITNPIKNVSIHRMFMGANRLGIDGNHFFVPKPSQYMLAIEGKVQQFELKKGSKFLFYWQHPSHSVRASFKATFALGSISIILAIIAIILGIIPLVRQ